jgi:pimeloyl-ACP methyl ester carboxylesterase
MIEWFLVGLAGVVLAPTVAEVFRPRMGPQPRHSAPGKFADLSRGVTHYQWLGPEDGPVVVCVHGLTTPSFVWEGITPRLAEAGYRVLTYDLYGRGFSDRPRGAQEAEYFTAQLDELLEHLGVVGKFTLIGYSMGGSIGACYAAQHQERLKSLILLAPAGMGHDLGPVARLVVNYGGFGRWLFMAMYGRSFRQGTEMERDLPSSVPDIVDRQQNELRYRGFRGAVLSSMRGILDRDLEEEHRSVAESGLPVLAIWARDDDVIPISGMGKLAEWNRRAEHEVIEGAGHALAYSHSDEVVGLLLPALETVQK